MIEAHRLSAHRGGHLVLREVDLRVEPGQVLGVVGPNGSGKSTLLGCLSGTVPSSSGEVMLEGRALTSWAARSRARRMAVLSQTDAASAPPAMTVRDLVSLGRLAHQGLFAHPSPADRRRVDQAMTQLDVAGLAQRRLDQLSGGERQRAHIARTLAQDAPCLLLDEPTNHIDARHQHRVLSRLAAPHRAVVVVLHDLSLASRYCTHVALLNRGAMAAYGPPAQVLRPAILEQAFGVRVQQVLGRDRSFFAFGDDATGVEH